MHTIKSITDGLALTLSGKAIDCFWVWKPVLTRDSVSDQLAVTRFLIGRSNDARFVWWIAERQAGGGPIASETV